MNTADFPSETLAETMLAVRSHPVQARPRGLSRRIVGALTIAAMSLSLMAAPAHADRRSDDLAKALAAIAAIALIGNAIQKNNNNHYTPRPPAPLPPPPVHVPPHGGYAPRLPSVCEIRVESHRRVETVYAQSCLRDEGFDYRLPRECARDVRLYGRNDRIYSAECLRDAGFRTEGRRHY